MHSLAWEMVVMEENKENVASSDNRASQGGSS